MRVRREWRQIVRQHGGDLDVLGLELIRQQLDRFPDDLIEGHPGPFRWPLSRERQEIADDPCTPTSSGVDLFRAVLDRDACAALPKQVRLTHDDGERNVEL